MRFPAPFFSSRHGAGRGGGKLPLQSIRKTGYSLRHECRRCSSVSMSRRGDPPADTRAASHGGAVRMRPGRGSPAASIHGVPASGPAEEVRLDPGPPRRGVDLLRDLPGAPPAPGGPSSSFAGCFCRSDGHGPRPGASGTSRKRKPMRLNPKNRLNRHDLYRNFNSRRSDQMSDEQFSCSTPSADTDKPPC